MKAWFRVELDEKGNVLRTVKQRAPGEDSAAVVYVEAAGAEAAGRLAMNRYAARIVRARRARYRAEGRCQCGRDLEDAGMRSCRVCRSNMAAHRERKAAGTVGGDALRLEKSEKRSRDREAEIRHKVLLELEAKLATMKTTTAIRLWLRNEIRVLKKLPKLQRVS